MTSKFFVTSSCILAKRNTLTYKYNLISLLEIKNLPAPPSVQDEMPEPKKPTKISTVKLITTDPAQFDEVRFQCFNPKNAPVQF